MKTFHCIKCGKPLALQGEMENPTMFCPNTDCVRWGLVTVVSDLKEVESG